MRESARRYFEQLQDRICADLESADGKARFVEDLWRHEPGRGPGGGGGRTRVIQGGGVFEKGGVNLSAVSGELSESLAARLETRRQGFHATGLSLVLHPESPLVPTVHMNLRYLELASRDAPRGAWFGGGADLTPYYLDEQDAQSFHARFKKACDRHDPDSYPRFTKQCDEYFFLPPRNEARGIGGLFFDYLTEDLERVFDFVRDVGDAFVDAYVPIVERHSSRPWTADQKRWQRLRRGRYVEFNLIHDRGTLFGLETGGRTESILMSLPPEASWEYDHQVPEGSAEAELLDVVRRPRGWA